MGDDHTMSGLLFAQGGACWFVGMGMSCSLFVGMRNGVRRGAAWILDGSLIVRCTTEGQQGKTQSEGMVHGASTLILRRSRSIFGVFTRAFIEGDARCRAAPPENQCVCSPRHPETMLHHVSFWAGLSRPVTAVRCRETSHKLATCRTLPHVLRGSSAMFHLV